MAVSIAHLGPTGTNAEAAALQYANWLTATAGQGSLRCPYPSIALSLRAVAEGHVDMKDVPIENSTGGSVPATLDGLRQYGNL